MNIDKILSTLNERGVDYILIGGVNFLLRHAPELTFDVDVWVRDEDPNLQRLNAALRDLGAAWGATEKQWAPVPDDHRWLTRQPLFCVTTSQGALDIFRQVKGLENRYDECKAGAVTAATATGVPYIGLSDQHMLESQEALSPQEQRPTRIAILRAALKKPR